VFFKIFLVMFVVAKSMAGFDIEIVQYIFAIIAAFSMTVGNIVAISQNNIKRMLAYSSIAQAGYILIAMAVMSEYALTGGPVPYVHPRVHEGRGVPGRRRAHLRRPVGEKITDYNGLAKRAPARGLRHAAVPVLAGRSPAAGRIHVEVRPVLRRDLLDEDGSGVMTQWVWLAFVAILNSAISLYYYVRDHQGHVRREARRKGPAGQQAEDPEDLRDRNRGLCRSSSSCSVCTPTSSSTSAQTLQRH
jgi:NADH-quinone oxidoreductase subunit N